MAKDSKRSTGKPVKAKAPQDLTKAGKKAGVEINEEDLKQVAGGCATGKHLTVD